jgi:hypothetical protein
MTPGEGAPRNGSSRLKFLLVQLKILLADPAAHAGVALDDRLLPIIPPAGVKISRPAKVRHGHGVVVDQPAFGTIAVCVFVGHFCNTSNGFTRPDGTVRPLARTG